jgi:hypothetical protein
MKCYVNKRYRMHHACRITVKFIEIFRFRKKFREHFRFRKNLSKILRKKEDFCENFRETKKFRESKFRKNKPIFACFSKFGAGLIACDSAT